MVDIEKLSLKELEELNAKISKKLKTSYERETIDKIIENKKYIGKCYKKDDLYIQILSPLSSNHCSFECICFEFPIAFDNLHTFNNYLYSSIDFDGIYIDNIGLLCNAPNNKKIIDSYEEITQEIFFKKMDEYYLDLKNKIKNGYFDTSINIK